MRKRRLLIEIKQENIVECDTKSCDYVIPNPTRDPNILGTEYINQSCPKCGKNLLTQADYDAYNRFMKLINWLNKNFSWLTYIFPSKNDEETAKVKIRAKK